MKILFLLTQDGHSPAGIGRYFPLARGLTKLGHQVTIAALHSDFEALALREVRQDGIHLHYVAPMHVRKQGNQKYYYPTHQLLPIITRATWALSYAALTIPTDIVHIGKPQPMNTIAGLLAKTYHGYPLVVDFDDLESANNRFTSTWQHTGVAFFEKLGLRRADHITTHTSVLRDYLLTLGIPESRIMMLRHGVDLERFTQPSATQLEHLREQMRLKGKRVIVFVGSMSLVSHAVDILVRAFAQIRNQVPNAILLLVGGGEDYQTIQEQVAELHLEDAVRFCGRVSSAETVMYYHLADVSVDPIHDNPAGRASLSLKMFETWASGVPLVTVDVGDRKEMLGTPPAGILVPPESPEALADAILNVLHDTQTAATLRRRSLERAKHFDWETLSQQVERLYTTLLFPTSGRHR